jgi:hypothetical protein
MADQSGQSLFEARGVLLCVRCGTIASVPVSHAAQEPPPCAVCGAVKCPRDISTDPVGSDPKNALWGFLNF